MSYDSVKSMKDLNEAILNAEIRRTEKYVAMKDHFSELVNGLRVKNLLKDAISDFKVDGKVPGAILNSASAIAVGYASKKLFEAGSPNRIRRLLGTALMFGVSKWIDGNPQMLNSIRDRVSGWMKQFGNGAKSRDSSES